jgi:mono/diheme cytochrome c family protein
MPRFSLSAAVLSAAALPVCAAEPCPVVERVTVNDKVVWELRDGKPVGRAEGRPGDLVVIEGRHFGPDATQNFSQATINRAAPLKADIVFHRYRVDLARLKQYADYDTPQDPAPRELLAWTDTRIEFRIPQYATSGPLVVTRQPVIGKRRSFVDGGDVAYEPEYVTKSKDPKAGVPKVTVRELGRPVDSDPVAFTVLGQEENIRKGRDLFWYWPQYSQVGYSIMDSRLDKLLDETWTDVDGVSPGARRGKWSPVPDLAVYGWLHFTTMGPKGNNYDGRRNPDRGPAAPVEPVVFENAYRNIVYPFLQSGPDRLPRMTIKSEATDWVGIVETEFNNALDGRISKAPGVSCATCHVTLVPGPRGGELVAGLANYRIDFHAAFQHTRANLAGGKDRRRIFQSYGPGVLDFTSAHEDDAIYNPVSIGSHFGREALQRLSTAGLEGSIHHRNNMAYIHHGGLGRPTPEQSVALQTYLNSLQAELETLRPLGLYRHLEARASDPKAPYAAATVRSVTDAEFVKVPPAEYPAKFPELAAEYAAGREVFQRRCASCHTPSLGLYTSQQIIPLTRIGTYLPPSDRMIKTQGIRVAPLTHLYLRGQGGYLHDNHIKSLDDQLDPERGEPGSTLYRKYYETGPHTRRIKAVTEEQKKAADELNYFSPTREDGWYRVYDYQLLRKTFGVAEYGKAVGLPEVPHPFFVEDPDERRRLILYLNSL